MQRLAAPLLALVLVLFASSRARADEPAPAAAATIAPDRAWYGWQLLLVDAAAVGVVGVSFYEVESDALPATAAWVYGVGAPVIHAVHGHGGKAAASLLLRIAVPAALGLVAYQSSGDWDPMFGAIGAGMIAAIVIDDLVIAREDVAPARAPEPTAHVTPTASAVRGGGMVGLSATF